MTALPVCTSERCVCAWSLKRPERVPGSLNMLRTESQDPARIVSALNQGASSQRLCPVLKGCFHSYSLSFGHCVCCSPCTLVCCVNSFFSVMAIITIDGGDHRTLEAIRLCCIAIRFSNPGEMNLPGNWAIWPEREDIFAEWIWLKRDTSGALAWDPVAHKAAPCEAE